MLDSIDLLIGLSVVMLGLSMAVTVITQFVVSVANTRGRHLRRGLVDMLLQLDPALGAESSKKIADSILLHPLVSGTSLLRRSRLGAVVQREEFTKMLLALANGGNLEPAARGALQSALANNGIPDPEQTLRNIRSMTLQLEAASPEMAASARQALAIVQEARSDLVAKVHNWFDQTMDRVAQRFTASARAITFGGALLLAFALQVDTLELINRLNANDALRSALVERAKLASPGSAGGAASSIDFQYLLRQGLVHVPASWAQWSEGWEKINLAGVLLTAALLSLGAPFWYGLLQKLLQLRSVLARKDDEQRAARQGADAGGAPAAGSAAPAANAVAGERGDLTAVG
jgi:hypothetical protein